MDLLPPGNMPAPNMDGDNTRDFPDQWASSMWPSLYPRVIHRYPTTAARDADLAGLGPTARSFAYIDALASVTHWTGTAWRYGTGGPLIQAGITTYLFGGGNTLSLNIVFPNPKFAFTSAPAMTYGLYAATVNKAVVRRSGTVTTSGVQLTMYTTDGSAISGSVYADWTATQV